MATQNIGNSHQASHDLAPQAGVGRFGCVLPASLGFTFLTEQPTLARVGVLIGGLIVARVVAWFSQSGQTFSCLRARVV